MTAAAGLGPLAGTAAALAGGCIGAAVWSWLGWPLPFIVGAMVGGMAVGLLPIEAGIPPRLSAGMSVVIGIMVGSAFTPSILDDARNWAPTLAAIALYTATATAVGYALLRRVGRYDPVSAYCMSSPGGFMEMILLGRTLGADSRHIALVHAVRLTGVVMVLPWLMPRATTGGAVATIGGHGLPGALDWSIFAACGLGAALASRLGIPGAIMVGPLALSAAAHMVGITDARIPAPVVIAAQIVVGAAAGSGIMKLNPRALLKSSLFGLALVSSMLTLSAVFALALASLTGRPFATALLLFAPGSLPEMSLIALTLQIEPALISTHHLFRLVLIVTTLPLLLRWLVGRGATAKPRDPET